MFKSFKENKKVNSNSINLDNKFNELKNKEVLKEDLSIENKVERLSKIGLKEYRGSSSISIDNDNDFYYTKAKDNSVFPIHIPLYIDGKAFKKENDGDIIPVATTSLQKKDNVLPYFNFYINLENTKSNLLKYLGEKDPFLKKSGLKLKFHGFEIQNCSGDINLDEEIIKQKISQDMFLKSSDHIDDFLQEGYGIKEFKDSTFLNESGIINTLDKTKIESLLLDNQFIVYDNRLGSYVRFMYDYRNNEFIVNEDTAIEKIKNDLSGKGEDIEDHFPKKERLEYYQSIIFDFFKKT